MMLKAIFMDYYGTMVHEMGPIAIEVVKRMYQNSKADSPEEILGYWWKVYRKKLEEENGANFRKQHDVALDSFRDSLKHFESPEIPEKLLARMEEHWSTTAVYEDTATFLEQVPLPVYIVTNSDDIYVYENLKKHGLHPAGVFTSEQAKYSKPRNEIFLYALERTGLKPEEVMHIGDSLQSDVKCPNSVGIKSIWLNREAEAVPDGVVSVGGLMEILELPEMR